MIIKKTCNFEYEERDGIFRIMLEGEIDHHSAVAVRSAIDAKLYEFRPRHTVLDLSKIDFMDSSGLGLIMGRYALVNKYGGSFAVLDPSPAVLKIIRLAGMDRMITVLRTKEKKEV